MKKVFVLFFVLSVNAMAQDAAIKATNDTPDGSIVVSKESSPPAFGPVLPPLIKPTMDELTAPDMKRMLTAQREQQHWLAQKLAAQADLNKYDTQLQLWSKEIQNLMIELTKRYGCPGCDLGQDMRWIVPPPPPQPKKTE